MDENQPSHTTDTHDTMLVLQQKLQMNENVL